ncbi:MAG: hypothetical protein C5B50_26505 [Verrucomicrobia bacterium]|nr:MAG: hypothetical protein C5B50_26505 [Verrucomicrobiota bacterium]
MTTTSPRLYFWNSPHRGKILGWLLGVLVLGLTTIGLKMHLTFLGWAPSLVFTFGTFASVAVIIAAAIALLRLAERSGNRTTIVASAIFVFVYSALAVPTFIADIKSENDRYAESLREQASGQFLAGLFSTPAPLWFRAFILLCILAPLAIWIRAFVVYSRGHPARESTKETPRAQAEPVAESGIRVRCRSCRSLNAESAKFCSECGTQL